MSGHAPGTPADGRAPAGAGVPGTGQPSLAEMLRAHRRAAKLSQQQLADLAGVSVATIRDFEQHRTRQPAPASVARLATALGLTTGWDAGLTTGGPRPTAARPAAAPTKAAPTKAARQDAMPGQRIRVLGPLTVWRNGAQVPLGPPKQRAVLGLLALSPNRPVHRETLVDGMWGEDPPVAAVNLVQTYVGRLRHCLDPGRSAGDPAGLLVSGRTSYRLQVGPAQLDLLAANQLVADARAAHSDGDPEGACQRYAGALQLWRDVPLADVDLLRAHPAVTALGQQWTSTVAEYAQAAIAAGQPDQVLPYLRELARREPLDERAHSQLMLALACGGQQAEALRTFDTLRRRLADQLGIRPGAELAAAHARVLRQDLPTRAPRKPARITKPAGTGGAGRASRVVPRQLPPAVSHFAGRERELKRLSELLDQDTDATVIAAIGGTAGVGKTTLVTQWAHRVRDRFPDGQLYVNLRGFDPGGQVMSPAEAVRGLLDAQGVPPGRVPKSFDAQVGLYRSLLDGKRTLVVLDNARDAEQVRPLLPGAATAMVVVTSRSSLVGLVATGDAHPLPLDLLPADEARDLLASRVGDQRLDAEPAAVAEIIARCARLPLALSIAAARAVTHPGFPLATLAAELAGAADRLDVLAGGDPACEVRVVFFSSYATLTPAAATLFRRLGLHPGPDISTAAAASLAGQPVRTARQVLAELARVGLLREHAPGRYSFHDLLRAYAVDLVREAETDQQRSAATTRMFDHYLHSAQAAGCALDPLRDPMSIPLARAATGVTVERPATPAQALAWLTAECWVLLAAVRLAVQEGYDARTWQLAWALHWFLDRQGHWDDLVTTAREALAAATRLGDPCARAEAHRRVAAAANLLGQHTRAGTHLQHALALYTETGDPIGQADTYIGLALLCEDQGRPQEALAHTRHALGRYAAAGHGRGQATALNNIGWYHALLEDHGQALTHCEQALALNQQQGYRFGEAATSDSLGYIHHHLGNHPQAVACYERALGLYQDLGDRYNQAGTLTRLGDAHHAVRNGAAAATWQQALTILADLDHADTAAVRARLATLEQPGQ